MVRAGTRERARCLRSPFPGSPRHAGTSTVNPVLVSDIYPQFKSNARAFPLRGRLEPLQEVAGLLGLRGVADRLRQGPEDGYGALDVAPVGQLDRLVVPRHEVTEVLDLADLVDPQLEGAAPLGPARGVA